MGDLMKHSRFLYISKFKTIDPRQADAFLLHLLLQTKNGFKVTKCIAHASDTF